MTELSLGILLVLGTLAGAINAAVGSGSLLTLPVLMALGVPPGTAVRTNTLGIMFSTIGSVSGYRKEILAERSQLGPLSVVALVGASTGSILLLLAPGGALDIVVPILIIVALILVVFQKQISALIARAGSPARDRSSGRRTGVSGQAAAGAAGTPGAVGADDPAAVGPYRSGPLVASMGLASVYGGFFTAAQGVLYMGLLGAFTRRPLGEVNPVKNWLSLIVNGVAVAVYLFAHVVWSAPILWIASGAIAVGALLGGYFGAHLAKRLPDAVLRGVIVVVALVALVRQFV